MVGRHKKPEIPLYQDFSIEDGEGNKKTLKKIQIQCPICESGDIREDGTKSSGKTRIQSYKCHNSSCSWLNNHKGGKQFTIFSSLFICMILGKYLQQILNLIGKSQGKLADIGKYYSLSPSLMTYLNDKFQESLDQHHGLHNLVSTLQCDRAIALDETFLKIKGKAYYIIIATGYYSHKVLGLKVSRTRTWKDIFEVFLEADNNTVDQIEIVTADAWGGTKTCIKNLKRPMTLITHRHKKPYKDVVIEKYEYEGNIRKITTIGVKTDFVKKRAKKEYRYIESTEMVNLPAKKKRGRPKGVKNGQGKKKKLPGPKKKRGRKNFLTIFNKGTKGYAKVDPYRKTVRVGKEISPAVRAALGDVVNLFAKIYIQNNLAENINSVLSNQMVLSGPKSEISIERRLRAVLICRNNPRILETLMINHKFQQKFIIKQILQSPLFSLLED